MRKLASMLPSWLVTLLRRTRRSLDNLVYARKGRFCPVCGSHSLQFRRGGINSREDARCIHCGALERHRLLWLFVTRQTDLFDGKPKKMLHVAPELSLEPRFRSLLGSNYITADLSNPSAMIKMDITDIKQAERSFDVIYCSHVLEHVPDDRKAMREFRRVLKDDAWAILLVPVITDKTFEDPSIVEPAERLKAFGHTTHVRRYGTDYVDRLREAGFDVRIATPTDLVGADDVVRMGLTAAAGEIYYCTKSSHRTESMGSTLIL